MFLIWIFSLGEERESPPLKILSVVILLLILLLIPNWRFKYLLMFILTISYLIFLVVYYSILILKTKTCKICGKKERCRKIKKFASSPREAKRLYDEGIDFYLLSSDGSAICSDCYDSYPKCVSCDNIITGKSYLTNKNRKLCEECYQLYRDLSRFCHICSIPIEDYLNITLLVSLGKRVCEKCAKKLPLCDCCNRPILDESIKRDSRHICPACFKNVVIYEDALPSMTREVKNIMKKMLNIEIEHNVEVRMCSAAEMKDKRGTVNWGYFCQDGGNFKVKILRYLTKPNIYKVLAHELAHAWQEENCPPYSNTKKRFSEGFAEWVAYKVLISLGQTNEAQRMEQGMWGDYLEGFKKFKELEEKLGIDKIISQVKNYTDFLS